MRKHVKCLWIAVVIGIGAVSEALPQQCTPAPPGLVAWWPGNSDLRDAAGSNDATPQNGASFGDGMVQQAFRFDGVDDYLSVPDAASLRKTDAISIEFWANFSRLPQRGDFADGMVIVEKDDDYRVLWRAEGGVLGFDITDACDHLMHLGLVLPMPAAQTGQWHHFAFTAADGGPTGFEMHAFVDGLEHQTIRNSMHDYCGFFAASTGELHIGALAAIGFGLLPFAGLIDELSIYDRVLTAEEIRTIAAAGSAGKCSNVPDGDGDGIPDAQDACPASIRTPTVMIGSCDSNVANSLSAAGCSISDDVQDCAASAANHGQFASCVAHLAADLRRTGRIGREEQGAI